MSQVDYGLAPTTKLSTKSVATPLARVKEFLIFLGTFIEIIPTDCKKN